MNMKKIAVTLLAVLSGTGAALAHQMEGGSTKGMFGLKPEYLHTLLNPLPVYGLSMGVLVMAAGLLARSKAARNIGLFIIVLCAASAWPVLLFGQHGYNHLYPQLDTESQQWLDVHMERADRFIYAFYLTALLGIAALVTQKKFLKTNKAFVLLTLFAAIASLGIGGWISRAGGEVSHSEFRNEDAPPPASSHQPDAHGEMEMSHTNDTYQQHGTSVQASDENKVPDTIEGIWTELHKHHSESEQAVNAKKFDEVHPHAVAINNLAKKLVEIVHPDHKAIVQDGANKITRAADDLHKASHAGNEAAAQESLKQLGDALKRLEEQMKKQ
jgi:soluble cytochrome b562